MALATQHIDYRIRVVITEQSKGLALEIRRTQPPRDVVRIAMKYLHSCNKLDSSRYVAVDVPQLENKLVACEYWWRPLKPMDPMDYEYYNNNI